MLRPLSGAKTYTRNAAMVLVAMRAILQESANFLPQHSAAVQFIELHADVCAWEMTIVRVEYTWIRWKTMPKECLSHLQRNRKRSLQGLLPFKPVF